MSMKHYQRLHWKQQQQRCHHPQIPTIILSPNNNVSSVPLLPVLTYTKQPEDHKNTDNKVVLFVGIFWTQWWQGKKGNAVTIRLELTSSTPVTTNNYWKSSLQRTRNSTYSEKVCSCESVLFTLFNNHSSYEYESTLKWGLCENISKNMLHFQNFTFYPEKDIWCILPCTWRVCMYMCVCMYTCMYVRIGICMYVRV